MRQEKLLDETDWGLLIVLDACRYDYFKETYSEYLKGDLKKAISPASNTMEWCRRVAGSYRFKEDVCVSANPHINSKMPVGNARWDPRDKFKKIYDAWLTDWSDEMPTVMPENMAEKTIEVREDTNRRLISWFVQPHAPFIGSVEKGANPFPRQEAGKQPMEVGGGNQGKLKQKLQFVIETFFPLPLLKAFWKYQVNVREIRVGPERVALANLSLEELRRAYVENLKIALDVVSELVKNIDEEEIVITADHGELLGDNKFFGKKIGHPAGYNYPELRTVPWLEAEK